MTYSFKKYLYSKDWRLIVIEIVSLLLAILSACLLEVKFFQIFISSMFWAGSFAVFIVFAVTFVAYVFADNFKAKPKEDRGRSYYWSIAFLIIIYIGVLTALLGMSNYTMAVLKTNNDSEKLNIKIANVYEIPVVITAKANMDSTIGVCNKELSRLQREIDNLTERSQTSVHSYAPQKQGYEDLKLVHGTHIEKAKADFDKVVEKESQRLTTVAMREANAGKSEGGIGKFISENPAILPVLALVLLFIGRLSFPAEYNAVQYNNGDVKTQIGIMEEHKITADMLPSSYQEAINIIVAEKRAGNGIGLQVLVAQKFQKSEAWVSKCVRKEMVKAVKSVN